MKEPTREAAVIGTLLELNGTEPGPCLARLLAHAPDSFDDQRHGEIATHVRMLRAEDRPVSSVAIASKVKFQDATAVIIGLMNEALPVDLAEIEAERVWGDYQQRQVRTVCGEALTALDARPEQAASIAEHVQHGLAHLKNEPGLSQRITERLFNIHVKPPEVVPRFWIGKTPICTPGNLTAISAPPKTAKTSYVAALIAATMTAEPERADCLGTTSSNPEGRAVIHFDTEQSIADHHASIERATRRALVTVPPAWLRSYCITGFSVSEKRQSLEMVMKQCGKDFGGTHSAILDGVADFVNNVNDPDECNGFANDLHALAMEYQCPIANVIHLNPGTEKTRGHLGSQLERKAETNLKLEWDGEAIVVWSDKNRRAPIPKAYGPRFAWSEDHKMFVSVQNAGAARAEADRESLFLQAEAVFTKAGKSALHWGEFNVLLAKEIKLSTDGARKRFDKMVKAQVIRKDVLKLYTLTQ